MKRHVRRFCRNITRPARVDTIEHHLANLAEVRHV